MDNEELDLAQRFAKQDLNQSRSDFTTQTNTILNKNHISNNKKKKIKREQHQTTQIKKIKKPQNVSYESQNLSSQGLQIHIIFYNISYATVHVVLFVRTSNLVIYIIINK